MDLTKLDLDDPDIQEALRVLQYDQKFNTEFKFFVDSAYWWQKKALNFTKDHSLVGLVSGNRPGKSYSAAGMATMCLTGKYPKWYEGKRWDEPITAMVASVDSNTNKRIWQKYLLGTNNRRMKAEIGSGMIPKDDILEESIVSVRGDDVQTLQVKHVSGGYSTLYFTSYSQGRESIQGFSGDLILIDEQPNVPFLQEAITRTKTVDGRVLLSFTPLEGMDYTLEQLLDLPDVPGSPSDDYGGCKIKSDGKWAMVRASWEDAPHITDNNPDAIEEAKRDFGIDFVCRVYGIPAVGSGSIYPHKLEDITYNPAKTVFNNQWDQLIGVDFGWSNNDPSAMLKMAWDETNDVIYILEEWKGSTPDDKTFVKHLNYIDPNIPISWPRDGSKASDWKGGGTIADKLRYDWGLNMLPTPFSNKPSHKPQCNALNPGFQEINDRLNTGRLKISTECQELMKELQFYHYGKDINGNSTGKPDKSCEDHLCDAMRYGVMSIIQGYGEPPQPFHNWEDDYEDFHYNAY